MKKNYLIALTSFLLMISANQSNASDISVSGFADIILTITDEANDPVGPGTNSTEGKFTVDAEVDFSSKLTKDISVRVDLDLAMAVNGGANASAVTGGPADSAVIEQAYFAWTLNPATTFLAGVFNNPVGWEGQDAPDLFQTSHNQNWGILDGQTLLHANNVAGIGLAGVIGPVTLTGAFLNDIQQVDEENSIAIVANLSPVKDLDLEFGIVTQDNDVPAAGGAGTVMDLNGTYSIDNYTVAVELLTADEIIDSSFMILGNAALPMGFGATVRIEKISFDGGAADTDVITLAGTYHAADNLDILIEWKSTDTGTTDTDLMTAEFVTKF